MPKYALLSVPIVLALLVGWLAYEIRFALLNPPTREEIRRAPLYTGPGGSGGEFDFEAWERDWQERNKAGKTTPEDGPTPAPAPSDGKLNPMAYRQNKEIARRNAYVVSRKCGAVAGIIALVLGYVGLGVYFLRLRARKPKAAGRRTAAQGQALSMQDITPYSEAPYDAPETEMPVHEVADDEGPYEPYEPPVHISELEEAHDEDRQDPRDKDTQPT